MNVTYLGATGFMCVMEWSGYVAVGVTLSMRVLPSAAPLSHHMDWSLLWHSTLPLSECTGSKGSDLSVSTLHTDLNDYYTLSDH